MLNPGSEEADYAALLEEVIEAKDAARRLVTLEPENKEFHRFYGMYLGQALDIRKEIRKARDVDRDRLLLDALRAVGCFFQERGDTAAAQTVADHLETIAEAVLRQWETAAPASSTAALKPSATRSPAHSPRSRMQSRKRAKSAEIAPATDSASSPKPTSPIT